MVILADAGVRGRIYHRYDVTRDTPLENFLDHFLDRKKGYVLTRPSFLDDAKIEVTAEFQ